MKNILNKKHKGIGGLYFITTNIICAAIMVLALKLSWDSQVIAMSDNLSYIVSINTTVNCYIGNIDPFEKEIKETDSPIKLKSGKGYNPLSDFNNMLKESGLSQNGASRCKIKWTGNKTYIQIGEFETSLQTKVRPHQQESVIENY